MEGPKAEIWQKKNLDLASAVFRDRIWPDRIWSDIVFFKKKYVDRIWPDRIRPKGVFWGSGQIWPSVFLHFLGVFLRSVVECKIFGYVPHVWVNSRGVWVFNDIFGAFNIFLVRSNFFGCVQHF